jgi:outer membrane protein OmpA-like peptidoglycan-associated protein
MPLLLSTTPGIEGMKAPVASLPAQWTYWNSNTFTVSTQTKSLSHVDFDIMLISKSAYIEGSVKDKKTLNAWENATIFLYNKLDEIVYVAKTDEQGNFKIKIHIPFEGVIKAIDKSTVNDCLMLSAVYIQQDSIQKISRDLLLEKLFIGKVLKLNNIHYNFDKWNIRADARPILDSIVTLMKTYPVRIELSSHTDSRGSDAYNDHLSQRRAEAATNYIVQNGIDPSRIVFKEYRKRHLLFISKNGTPCSEAENAANRRTEFKVIGVIPIENQQNIIDPNLYKNGERLDRNALPADFFEPCQ